MPANITTTEPPLWRVTQLESPNISVEEDVAEILLQRRLARGEDSIGIHKIGDPIRRRLAQDYHKAGLLKLTEQRTSKPIYVSENIIARIQEGS